MRIERLLWYHDDVLKILIKTQFFFFSFKNSNFYTLHNLPLISQNVGIVYNLSSDKIGIFMFFLSQVPRFA